jgi:hypothetical protein
MRLAKPSCIFGLQYSGFEVARHASIDYLFAIHTIEELL